jgi:anaerobic ribonucleoside-triphosphate reductase activating protein
MNYDRYYTHDVVNGEGLRVTLFVTGCAHACEGCYNRSTWNRQSGRPFTSDVQEALLASCVAHDGLSLTGGDPLFPRNRDSILALCRAFKYRYPDKDIWMWTGYLFEEVQGLAVMDFVDVLIDGKFQADNPTVKPWRGSDNQRLFRVTEDRRIAADRC